MSGYVIVTICPLYEGSVRISWYPVIDVWKTTSPSDVPDAPKARPVKTVPSSSASLATRSDDTDSGLFAAFIGRRIIAIPDRPAMHLVARANRLTIGPPFL